MRPLQLLFQITNCEFQCLREPLYAYLQKTSRSESSIWVATKPTGVATTLDLRTIGAIARRINEGRNQ